MINMTVLGMSGLSRFGLHVKPWIGMESVKLMSRSMFGHVNTNPCSLQCRIVLRLQRFTTEPNVNKDALQGGNIPLLESVKGSSHSISDTSLADISKPVPFNTHQLVCRLQSRGGVTKCCEVFM